MFETVALSFSQGQLFQSDRNCICWRFYLPIDVVAGEKLVGENIVGEFLLDFPFHRFVVWSIFIAGEAHFHVGRHHHKTEVAILDLGKDASFLFWIAFVQLLAEVSEELPELPLVIHLPFDDQLVLYPFDRNDFSFLHGDEVLMLIVAGEAHVFIKDFLA